MRPDIGAIFFSGSVVSLPMPPGTARGGSFTNLRWEITFALPSTAF
jgi:hypothetical protein